MNGPSFPVALNQEGRAHIYPNTRPSTLLAPKTARLEEERRCPTMALVRERGAFKATTQKPEAAPGVQPVSSFVRGGMGRCLRKDRK